MPDAEVAAFELVVLIPARDEARNLQTCVESLAAQSEDTFLLGRDWQIIIVDDHSTDDTPEIARRLAEGHDGILVLSAPDLKQERNSFTGKNAALWFGAQQASAKSAKWLLFTDADTIHEPGALHRSIVEADRHDVALLSYSPRQIVAGLVQRAVMPLIFSELASVYSPKKVNDPSSPVAAANGQFLLAKRETYFQVGGHSAVADRVLEDVALAKLFKRRHAIRLRYAPEAVSARMYGSVAEMWAGWTKNLALLFANPLLLALNRALDFCLLLGLLPGISVLPYLTSLQKGALSLLWVRVVVRYYNRVRRSNFPPLDCLLSIIGLPVFIALLIRSWQQVTLLKRVSWKGREYRT